MNQPKQEKFYQLTADLAEWRLFQRLRQIRHSGENVILLIQAADCREVGSLPGETMTRFNSREKG